MGWGSHCPDCGKTDCKWVHGPVCQGTLPDFIKKFDALKAENERLERERDKWEQRACTGDDVLARTRDKLAAAEAALVAKDAELAKRPDWPTVNATYEKWKVRAERAEARVAELEKALEEVAHLWRHGIADTRAELSTSFDYNLGLNDALFRVRQIARRALKGGKEDG